MMCTFLTRHFKILGKKIASSHRKTCASAVCKYNYSCSNMRQNILINTYLNGIRQTFKSYKNICIRTYLTYSTTHYIVIITNRWVYKSYYIHEIIPRHSWLVWTVTKKNDCYYFKTWTSWDKFIGLWLFIFYLLRRVSRLLINKYYNM